METGLILRTTWEEYIGHITGDREQPGLPSDLLMFAIMCGIGLALIGFEKFAGALITGTFFSVNLAQALLLNTTWSSTAIAFTY